MFGSVPDSEDYEILNPPFVEPRPYSPSLSDATAFNSRPPGRPNNIGQQDPSPNSKAYKNRRSQTPASHLHPHPQPHPPPPSFGGPPLGAPPSNFAGAPPSTFGAPSFAPPPRPQSSYGGPSPPLGKPQAFKPHSSTFPPPPSDFSPRVDIDLTQQHRRPLPPDQFMFDSKYKKAYERSQKRDLSMNYPVAIANTNGLGMGSYGGASAMLGMAGTSPYYPSAGVYGYNGMNGMNGMGSMYGGGLGYSGPTFGYNQAPYAGYFPQPSVQAYYPQTTGYAGSVGMNPYAGSAYGGSAYGGSAYGGGSVYGSVAPYGSDYGGGYYGGRRHRRMSYGGRRRSPRYSRYGDDFSDDEYFD